MAQGDKHTFDFDGFNENIESEKVMVQDPGIGWIMNQRDKCKNEFGVIMESKLVKAVLDNVVVKPAKLKMDDFKDMGAFQEFMAEVNSFLGTNV